MRLAAGSETTTSSAASFSVSSRLGVLEVMQELDLGERQLERADRLEQVRVAVLVQEDDQRIQIRAGSATVAGWSVSTEVSCTHASIAHNLCLCKRN